MTAETLRHRGALTREYATFFIDPAEDKRPVCLADLRAVGVDPVAEHLKTARGPCWACAQRAMVVGQGAEGDAGLPRCLVCGARGRASVRISIGARAATIHLCRACAGPLRTLIERGGVALRKAR